MTSTAVTGGAEPCIADYYAGIIKATFDMDVREDLKACMATPDSELVSVWDKAIEGLTTADEAEWERYFTVAQVMGAFDLAPCEENEELSAVGK